MIAKEIKVIETTLTKRGNGTTTPIRTIKQYWSLDGDLLAEIDTYNKYEEIKNELQVLEDNAKLDGNTILLRNSIINLRRTLFDND